MPEPLVYLQAIAATAIVTTATVLLMATFRRLDTPTWRNGLCLAGTGLGLMAGVRVLSLQPAWPPASALDRLLVIVLPATLSVELIGGCGWLSTRTTWCLRASLAAAVPFVLLYGSVYLNGDDADWQSWQIVMAMAFSSAVLLGTWTLLSLLSTQVAGGSVTWALSIATLSGGLCVMLAGYIKGGAVALPLATALAAAVASGWLLVHRSAPSRHCWNVTDVPGAAVIGTGVVGLFSVLFIGRFFGRLTTAEALTVFLAPLLCCSTQVVRRRDRNPWLVGWIRLMLVGIPLAVVLFFAKRQFDANYAPLL